MVEQVQIAPDGGWGWVIVIGSALSNMIVIPIMQGFGLIFQEKFKILGFSATDSTIIINVNSAFGMALGLFNGALLKGFGFRKIGLIGSILIFIGVTSTAFANTFAQFIITYSIIASMGIAWNLSAFNLALNTYFKERRSKAMGYCMTLTGLGPVFMPLLISFFLSYYGVTGTVLILGGLSLHAVLASILLQPVHWHIKTKTDEIVDVQVKEIEKESTPTVQQNEEPELENYTRRRTYTNASVDYDIDSCTIFNYDNPVPNRRDSICSGQLIKVPNRRHSLIYHRNNELDSNIYKWNSLNGIDIGNISLKLENKTKEHSTTNQEKDVLMLKDKVDNDTGKQLLLNENENKDVEIKEISKKKKSLIYRNLLRVFYYLDLDLLRDPGYVILMLGMSIAIYSEFNFSVLTPFILGDMDFTTKESATIMSIVASVDIVFRLLSPYIGDFLKYEAKHMYMISMIILIIGRSGLIFFKTFSAVMWIAVVLGVGKGIRTVYMTLVIPAYVPLVRLASASGIQTVTNGLILLVLGPLLGVIRDRTGDYNIPIMFINSLTALTVVMWTIQDIVIRIRNKRNSETKEIV